MVSNDSGGLAVIMRAFTGRRSIETLQSERLLRALLYSGIRVIEVAAHACATSYQYCAGRCATWRPPAWITSASGSQF